MKPLTVLLANEQISRIHLLSCTDGKTLVVAFDEVQVIPRPVERLEPWRKPEEQGLTGPIEVVAHVQRAGC